MRTEPTRRRRATPVINAAVALLVLVVLAAACTDSTDDTAGGAEPTPSTAGDEADPGPSADDPEPGGPAEAEWVVHAAPDDCQCADGSEFEFLSRTADPTKVVLYFEGGGACFSAETCAFEGGTYKVQAGVDRVVAGDDAAGIFDFEAAGNPLVDWSFVYVPYCTGDVHIGNTVHTYTDELEVAHLGYRNGSAALEHLVASFPDATEVLVTGSSAGGVPSPLFGGLVADRLPDADVRVLADGSGAYPDNPPVNAAIGGLWGTMNAVPDWPVTEGLTPEDYSIPGLFTLAGLEHPEIHFARFDHAYDAVQRDFSRLAQVGGGDQLAVVLANEAGIESSGVPVVSYIAAGDDHTILARDDFYDIETDGVPFLVWFSDFLAGDDVEDIRCDDCGATG